jgi:hypothetical protein
MSDFSLKYVDRLPVLRSNISDESGYLDISNATVSFIYQTYDRSTPPVTGSASVLGATSGFVEFAWTTGSFSGAGVFYGEWRVTMSGGKEVTCPNDSYLVFDINPRLT